MSRMTGNGPKPWWQIYQGDDECKFFKELARSKYDWRTTDSLAKAAALSSKRVEEIAQKYVLIGLVRTHSSEPGKWQYWERAAPKAKKGSVAGEDHKKRIDEAA